MSPETLILPVMNAVIGFCFPEASLRKLSSETVMVASASPPPSFTVTPPPRTSTSHWPAPVTSKRYELSIPPIFDASTRDGRPSKNSRTESATCSLLGREQAQARVAHRPPRLGAGRRQEEPEQH